MSPPGSAEGGRRGAGAPASSIARPTFSLCSPDHTCALCFSSWMSGHFLMGGCCRPNTAPGCPACPSSTWAGWNRERPQQRSTASCPAHSRWDRDCGRVPGM